MCYWKLTLMRTVTSRGPHWPPDLSAPNLRLHPLELWGKCFV